MSLVQRTFARRARPAQNRLSALRRECASTSRLSPTLAAAPEQVMPYYVSAGQLLLDSILPILRSPASVRNGDNLDRRRTFAENNQIREPRKKDPSGSEC